MTDVVTLLGDVPKYWPSDPRVPQFIMRMDDAGRQAQRAGLPISDAWLAAFTTSALLKANLFPNDRPRWDGQPKTNQTWTAWKAFFEPLHKNLERETRVSRNEDALGTAAAAQVIHGVNPDAASNPFRIDAPGLPNGANLAADYDAHFNNLATAATHGNKIVTATLTANASKANDHHTESRNSSAS